MKIEVHVLDIFVQFVLFYVFLEFVNDELLSTFSFTKQISNKDSTVSFLKFWEVFIVNLMSKLKSSGQFD